MKFLKIKKLFPQSHLLRNAARLAGGTFLGQAVSVAALPVLTRFFTPEDFGVLGVYASILGVLLVIGSFRYELAIPLPEDDVTAANLLALSSALVLVVSLLVWGSVWLFGSKIVLWMNVPALERYLWLLPLGLLGAGMYQSLNYWAARKQLFSLLALSRVAQAFSQAGIQAFTGFLGLGPLGLLLGYITGRVLAAFALLPRAWSSISVIQWSAIIKAALRYRNFPLYTAWASLINVIGTQAPPVLFSRYFSVEAAGFYSLTMRVLGLPSALIGQSVGQVFYPMAAEKAGNPEAAKTLVERTASTLFVVSFPIFSLIALLGPELFALIFGREWAIAGRYAQYLTPWLFMSFISSPLSTFVFAKGRQKQAFWFTLYETLLRLLAIEGGRLLGSPDWAVKLYSTAGVLITLVYLQWVLRLAGSSLWLLGAHLREIIFLASVLFVILGFLDQLLEFRTALPVIAGGLSMFTIWALGRVLKDGVEHNA